MNNISEVMVKVENNFITAVISSKYLTDSSGWEKIDEGVGQKYSNAQNWYFEKMLINQDGTHNYRFDGTMQYHQATAQELATELAEIEANRPPVPPTVEEQLTEVKAQLAQSDAAALELYELVLSKMGGGV